MKHTLPVVAAAALLLGCDHATNPVEPKSTLALGAEITRTATTTLTGALEITNTCTQEVITYSGVEFGTVTTVAGPSGRTLTVIHDQIIASGESDLGFRYQAILVTQAVTVSAENLPPGEPQVETVPVRGRIIGQGPSADITFDALLHITSVDGQTTAHLDIFSESCLF